MDSDGFSRIIGHERVLEVIRRMIQHGTVPHALLLVGPESVGKSAIITVLKEELLGSTAVHADSHTVRRLVDEKTGKQKSQISVEQIRQLREQLSMSALGSRKFALIEEADRMSLAASNALLKTLEEPSGETVIVLRAETLEAIPETIRSRSQLVRLGFVPEPLIQTALIERGIAKGQAAGFAKLSGGRPGHAIRLIEDGAFRSELEVISAAFLRMKSSSLAERFAYAADSLPKEEVNKAAALEQQLSIWESHLREQLHEAIRTQQFSALPVEALEALKESRAGMAQNINPQLALEHVLLRL